MTFILKSQLGILTAESDFTLEVEAPVGRVLVRPVLYVVAVGQPVGLELGTVGHEGGQRLSVNLETSTQVKFLQRGLVDRHVNQAH